MSINVNQCQSWHQHKTHLDCSLPSLTQVANCSSPSSHLVLLSCYWHGFCILICICCISCHGNRFCIWFFRSRSLIVFELCVCNLYLPLWSHLHTKNPSILICKRMVRGWMSGFVLSMHFFSHHVFACHCNETLCAIISRNAPGMTQTKAAGLARALERCRCILHGRQLQ